MKIGVVQGRFQMLHVGHMEYLLEGMRRCDKLIVGICNPDPELTKYSKNNPHRSTLLSNPLTYFERMEIIKQALIDSQVKQKEFDIVPFPINFPERIKFYVPENAVYFITIYDAWGLEKRKILADLGYNVEVMWERSNAEKITSGSEVREKILKGEEWRHLVPKATYNYVMDHGIDKRIVEMLSANGSRNED